jgi:Terpene cyclase DEP1
MMGISPKHLIYVGAAVASLIWAWSHAFAWMAGGGNLINLPSFFIDSYNSGSAAAFLTIDIAVAWGVFMIWVVGDAAKIGLGAKTGWIFVGLSFLGTCFAFPLYLVMRERHLAKAGQLA